jgi:hypothetical protein
VDKQPQPKQAPQAKSPYSRKAQQQLEQAYKNLPTLLKSLMDPRAKA